MDHSGKVMKAYHRITKRIITIFIIFVMMVVLFLFAPSQFGGKTTFLVISGISMEPLFHKGDLVIVRASNDYQVGDIVAYKNQEMSGLPVIHRIIKYETGNYFFKGDNNNWIDSYTPTKEELIGKLWIFIPKFGRIVQWLSAPSHLLLVLLLMGGIFMIKPISDQKKRKNKKKADVSEHTSIIEGVTIAGFILGALFLVLGIFAFSRPLMQSPQKIAYTQTGNFGYSASSVSGVYDNDSINSGQPIYTKLTCRVYIKYGYSFTGDKSIHTSGKQSLSILIEDPASGWKRTISDSGDLIFNGNSYTAKSTIDVCQVKRIVEDYLKIAQVESKLFTLIILPKTEMKGSFNGQLFSSKFEPNLILNFDLTHFYMPSNDQEGNPLVVTKEGSFTSNISQPNTMTFLGMEPTVKSMRIFSIIGLLFCLLLLGAIGYFFLLTAKKNEDESIRLRFHSLLVDIQDSSSEFSPQTLFFDMSTIDDLAKIAERDSTLIMHILSDPKVGGQYYVVKTERGFYRYISNISDLEAASPTSFDTTFEENKD